MINTINNKVFRNANEAYKYLHDKIIQEGTSFGDTKALFNVGFYITDPKDRKINVLFHNVMHKFLVINFIVIIVKTVCENQYMVIILK